VAQLLRQSSLFSDVHAGQIIGSTVMQLKIPGFLRTQEQQ
jgi:hypothetical protein